MAGPNWVGLDKGHLATGGSQAYKLGESVVLGATQDQVARATSAGAQVLGVCQEDIDAAKVNTGKAVINIRMLGISYCIAGAAIAIGAKLTNDTSARVVTQAGAVGSGSPVMGVALSAAAAAGDLIQVMLTPYNAV
jgi:hypothetical protein